MAAVPAQDAVDLAMLADMAKENGAEITPWGLSIFRDDGRPTRKLNARCRRMLLAVVRGDRQEMKRIEARGPGIKSDDGPYLFAGDAFTTRCIRVWMHRSGIVAAIRYP